MHQMVDIMVKDERRQSKMIEDLKTTLRTALAMCEFAKCSHASIENTNIQEILRIISDYEDLKQQFYYLDVECSRLEKVHGKHEAEIQEYHDFLESLIDFLIWDTGKRAREARYKIEAFLKRIGERKNVD